MFLCILTGGVDADEPAPALLVSTEVGLLAAFIQHLTKSCTQKRVREPMSNTWAKTETTRGTQRLEFGAAMGGVGVSRIAGRPRPGASRDC